MRGCDSSTYVLILALASFAVQFSDSSSSNQVPPLLNTKVGAYEPLHNSRSLSPSFPNVVLIYEFNSNHVRFWALHLQPFHSYRSLVHVKTSLVSFFLLLMCHESSKKTSWANVETGANTPGHATFM